MANYQINARNLMCPLPVIRAQDQIKELSVGDTLTVFSTDPGALNDIPAWCRINGHEVIHTADNDFEVEITIKVGADSICPT